MGYVNQGLSRLAVRNRASAAYYLMYPVAMCFFFNGLMDIVCILGICFPSKHQVPTNGAVTAHQVPNCIQLEQYE